MSACRPRRIPRANKMRQTYAILFSIFAAYATQVGSLRLKHLNNIWGESSTSQRSVAPHGRLANGKPANRGQFPHQAFIVADNVNQCGGSLIAHDWVLTSALCTYQKSTYLVTLGVVDLSTADDYSKTVTSRNAITHENFNVYTFVDDIGLIRIPPVASYNQFLKPVRLPAYHDASNTFYMSQVEISGWGSICGGEGFVKDLLFVTTEVISNGDCATIFPNYAVPSSKLCTFSAGYEGILSHDSGDPVVIVQQGVYTQIAVASFSSPNACYSAVPSAHTRLTSYLDWLQARTGVVGAGTDHAA